MAKPDDKKQLPLTPETFARVAELVSPRDEVLYMIARDQWVPEDLQRLIPDCLQERVKPAKMKADVVRVGYALITEYEVELAQYGMTFPPPAKVSDAT